MLFERAFFDFMIISIMNCVYDKKNQLPDFVRQSTKLASSQFKYKKLNLNRENTAFNIDIYQVH